MYGPPLNTNCTMLEGPATVRISKASSENSRGGGLIGSLLVEDESSMGRAIFTLLPVIPTMTSSPVVDCTADRVKNLSAS